MTSVGALADVPRFVVGDVLRYAAVLSVVVGTFAFGFIGFALFMLVLGGSLVPRVVSAPAALDLAFGATVLLAAWAAELDWYLAVGWLDVVVHAAATGLIAAVVHVLLVRLGAVAPVTAPEVRRPRLGSGVVTASLGVALAVVWEMLEWFGHTQIDDRIQVGYTDTMGDLTAGAVGAVVAGVLLARGVLLAGEGR